MDAEVVSLSRERACSARLPNDILVVYQAPANWDVALGDKLTFESLELDAESRVTNRFRGATCTVRVKANDVHDLRLPMRHGVSRTPSKERLCSP